MQINRRYGVKNWLIIILVIINIAALSSFIIAKISGTNKELIEDPEYGVEQILVEQIGFDQSQMSQYAYLKNKYDDEVFDIRRNMHEANIQMLEEVAIENPDTVEIEKLANKFGEYQAKLRMLTMTHLIELRKLAKPDQEERFLKFYAQLQQHQMRGFGRGKGMGRGRGMGFGRQYNGLPNNKIQGDTTTTEFKNN